MAATVAYRKRPASPFLVDEVVPAPAHLAKRGRFSPCPAVVASQLAFDPLEECRARQRQAREREAAAVAARVASASSIDDCAGVLAEQMSAAADLADARSRVSSVLKLIEGAIAKRAAAEAEAARAQSAALREENAALRARAEVLERDNGVLRRGVAAQHRRQEELERDNVVLKHGVAVLHQRQEEAERAAEETKKKVAELVAANYALSVQASVADSCRFQVFRGPDVF
jgi:hypothetical protein